MRLHKLLIKLSEIGSIFIEIFVICAKNDLKIVFLTVTVNSTNSKVKIFFCQQKRHKIVYFLLIVILKQDKMKQIQVFFLFKYSETEIRLNQIQETLN